MLPTKTMFFQPTTIPEALQLKAAQGAGARFIAGGTDLIVMRNHGRMEAGAFIDLSHVAGFDTVETLPDGLHHRAAGGATCARLARLPVRCVAEAAHSVGGPQIRNRATVAGNLASASPAADVATALLALDATVEMGSVRGVRAMPLRDFFLDYRKTALAPDELITSVTFPADWHTAWEKLGKRGAMNISLVCCAVGVSPAGDVRVAYGSVAAFPMLAVRTGGFLQDAGLRHGTPADEALIAEACRIAASEVRPVDDFRGSAEYRREMCGVLLRKCLRTIAAPSQLRTQAAD